MKKETGGTLDGPGLDRDTCRGACVSATVYRDSREECRTRRRIMHRFASREFEALARRVVHRIKRLEASGVFGNPDHRTVWDEFCHNRRTGPHPLLELAFDDVIERTILHLAGTVPEHVAILLTEYAGWMEDAGHEEAAMDDVDLFIVRSHLRSLVDQASLG